MPRLATIAIHAFAVAVLGVLAYKLLLESDPNGGAGAVRGEQIVKGATGRSERGASSGPGRKGGGAAGGARGAGPEAIGPGTNGAITATGTTRNALNDPAANQYGDALALIKNKLR